MEGGPRSLLTDLGTRRRRGHPGWPCSPHSVHYRRHPQSGPAAPPGLPGKQDEGRDGKQSKNRTNQKHNKNQSWECCRSRAHPLTGNTWAESQAPKPLCPGSKMSPFYLGSLRCLSEGTSWWPIINLPLVPQSPLSCLYSLTCLPQTCCKQGYDLYFPLLLFCTSLSSSFARCVHS